MESKEREPKYTRAQEAAYHKLWVWHYQQRFPIALYPLLQDLIVGLNDASIIQLLRIADAWKTASDKLQAEGRTKYPAGGAVCPQPYGGGVDIPPPIESYTPEPRTTIDSWDITFADMGLLKKYHDLLFPRINLTP